MFSWGNGNHTATAVHGSIRPPELTREQHLDSFMNDETLKRSTRRVSADDSTYDTVFQTVQRDTLILRVHLPPPIHPSAPVPRPLMTLMGVKARHPWLDTRMQVIGFESIGSDAQWRDSRLLLGKAVHLVIEHLQMNPPDILEITDGALRAIQPADRLAHHRRYPSQNESGASQQQGQTLHHSSGATDAPPTYDSMLSTPEIVVDLPRLPDKFPELEGLTREELDELYDNELAFMAFCNKLSFVKDQVLPKATGKLEENASTARSNLEQEERLKALYKETNELRDKVRDRVRRFKELEKQQNEICAPPDLRNVMRALAKAKRQTFDESERIAEDFLEEGGDIEDFCKQFVERRKVHHLQAAKLEMLQKGDVAS